MTMKFQMSLIGEYGSYAKYIAKYIIDNDSISGSLEIDTERFGNPDGIAPMVIEVKVSIPENKYVEGNQHDKL